MAKKEERVEEKVQYEGLEFQLDDEDINEVSKTELKKETPITKLQGTVESLVKKENELINCLRNERIIVRHVPRESGMVTNPKHILYGGMAEGAIRMFTVPKLESGIFVNVLTDSEKAYLEHIMGLEYNALSIYKKEDNFWSTASEHGISSVRLTKGDNYLNLASPDDYIKYKILLANKDNIAPSIQALQDRPRITYQFVVIREGEENKAAASNMSSTMESYKEYGKIENDIETLRVIIETLDGRPTSPHSKLEFLQTKINNLIQGDSKTFLRVIKDELLPVKVLIKQSIEAGLISKRGDYLYLREDNSPLCAEGQEPTFNIAAKFLSLPKNQELKFALEAKLKQ